MKRILTSAAALAILIGTPALAQDRDHNDNGGKHDSSAPAKPAKPAGGGDHNGGGGNHPNGGGGDRGGPNPNAGRGPVNPNYRAPGGYHGPAANPNDRGGSTRNDRNFNGNNAPNHNPNWNANNNNRNPNWNNNNRPGANRGPQARPRTFDRRVYQRNVQAQHRFRGGFYRKPPGWYYRRWNYGQILPFAFFARDYWLTDYYSYDLMAPPYGYEWVRYGDDALLVDTRSGMILQVEYGVFY